MELRLNRLFYIVKQQKNLFFMLLPGLITLILFSYLPMFGVISAFQKFDINKGFFKSPFVGFYNFTKFLSDPMIHNVIRNTIGISLLKLVIGFPIPIIFALLLNEIRKIYFKRVAQTISYLPHFVSWVIVIGIWGKMLAAEDGIVNNILTVLGIENINFMVEPALMWPLAVLTEIWKETGWGSIIYLAALTGINPQLYEASVVDGAGRLKQLWHITLAGIKSTISILLILSIPSVVSSNLDQMFVLGTLPVRDVTEVIDTYVLRMGIGSAQYSMAAAVGLVKTVIGVALIIIVNKIAKKMGETGVY